jgi:hypothetical protein
MAGKMAMVSDVEEFRNLCAEIPCASKYRIDPAAHNNSVCDRIDRNDCKSVFATNLTLSRAT